MPFTHGFGHWKTSATAEQSAQWNSADKNAAITLSNGDRDAAGGTLVSVRGLLGRSTGKYYWEVLVLTSIGNHWCGFGNAAANLGGYTGNSTNSAGMASGGNAVTGWTKSQTGVITYVANDILGFAIDLGAGYGWVAVNNSWQLTGDPAAGTNPWVSGISGTVYPMTSPGSGTDRISTKTAELAYSPPSGFSQWAAA